MHVMMDFAVHDTTLWRHMLQRLQQAGLNTLLREALVYAGNQASLAGAAVTAGITVSMDQDSGTVAWDGAPGGAPWRTTNDRLASDAMGTVAHDR